MQKKQVINILWSSYQTDFETLLSSLESKAEIELQLHN